MEKDYFFKPYVGDLYGRPENIFNGKKVLVIGHNHHCIDERFPMDSICRRDCQTFKRNLNSCKMKTDCVLRDYIEKLKKIKSENEGLRPQNSRHDRTFDNFGIFLTGNENLDDIIKAYDSIAFYNFCQFGVISQGKKPNAWMYKESEAPFYKVIRETDPDIILCWGIKTVMWNLPDDYKEGDYEGDHGNHEVKFDIKRYQIDEKHYVAIGFKHPAAFGRYKFDPYKMHKIIFPEIISILDQI